MLTKRVLALLLIAAMLSVFPVFGYAADGALSASSVTAKPGEQVRIEVTLQNPGIVGMRIFAAYDAACLRLDSVQNGVVFGDGHATFGNDLTLDPYTMLWDDSLRRDNITDSGLLCTLLFTVLDDAPAGETTVSIQTDAKSTFDVDLNPVPVADTTCTVTVERDDPQPTATLAIAQPSVTTVNYGYTLTLHAETADLPDGAAVEWSVDNAAMTAVSSTRGSDFSVKSVRTGSVTVTARLIAADGSTLTNADGSPITASLKLFSKAGLWQKLLYVIAWFLHKNCWIPR